MAGGNDPVRVRRRSTRTVPRRVPAVARPATLDWRLTPVPAGGSASRRRLRAAPTAARSSARGMVTAEAALVIPVLVAVTAALAWVVALGVVQIRLVDAAREGARLAARGEPAARVHEAALSAAPDGSSVHVQRDGDSWVAEVSVEVGTDLPLVGLLPPVEMSARAVSAAEADCRTCGSW